MNDSPPPAARSVILGTGKLPDSQAITPPSHQKNPRRWIIGGALILVGGIGLLATTDKILDLRSSNHKLGAQVIDLKNARTELEGQVTFLADIRSKLAAKLSDTETERDALTELATKLEEVNTLIKKDRDITRDKLVSSKLTAAELSKKLTARETRIAELQSIRDRLTTVNLDLKSELETAIAQAQSLERENNGLQKDIATLTRSESRLFDHVASLEAKLAKGQKENGHYAQQVTELLATVAEKDRELERLQNEVTKVEEEAPISAPTAQVSADVLP